jgi:hypothetical protein
LISQSRGLGDVYKRQVAPEVLMAVGMAPPEDSRMVADNEELLTDEFEEDDMDDDDDDDDFSEDYGIDEDFSGYDQYDY